MNQSNREYGVRSNSTKPMPRPVAGDEKNDSGSDDQQGRPVKVNAAGTDRSRDLQKPREYQQDGRTIAPTSPAMDDEDVDLESDTDFRQNSQKNADEGLSRNV